MRIYLDSCCYNRPFDDQTQERIHLESEAILTILNRGRTGAYAMLTTDDKLEKMAAKLQLKVRVMNPLRFAWEVI